MTTPSKVTSPRRTRKTNPALPTRRNYKPEFAVTTSSDLPFVLSENGCERVINRWHVKPIDDYALACEIAEEYAAHFVQYLKDNPDCVEMNLLGLIANDINFDDDSCAKGYWIGFFTYLELLLYKRVKNRKVFRDLDKHRAKCFQEA